MPEFSKSLFVIALLAASVLLSSNYTLANQAADNSVAQTTMILAELPIEDLMDVRVYSVAKQSEQVMESSAAIHVITREDILRSGATSIPDILRLAPGIHVARIDANKWSVSVRGFGDRFANKLLVLQDGRTIYTPNFSGVWWNIQDIMPEDIDRIEVIRGPGATLWGSNAVNGVINIITSQPQNTLGGLATAGGGTFEKGFGALRYGIKATDDLVFKGYAKYFSRDNQRNASGLDQEGGWDNRSGGFRTEWTPTNKDRVAVQGDLYDSRAGAAFFDGGNIITRWNRQFSDTQSSMMQAYFTHSEQIAVTDAATKFRERRNSFDLELQLNFQPVTTHKIVVGAGYRYTKDDTAWNSSSFFDPADKEDHLGSMFLQDELSLIPEELALTLGIRTEYNSYTGLELQPTGRIIWTPNRKQSLWGAVSRATRTPSRANDGINTTVASVAPEGLFPGSPEAFVKLFGSDTLKSENVMAYELGYRYHPSSSSWLDLAFFHNNYSRLISVSASSPYMDGNNLIIPFRAVNSIRVKTWGTEVSAFWHPIDILDLQCSYSWLTVTAEGDEPPQFRGMLSQIGTYPEQQFSVRSGIALPGKVRLDLWLRYIDQLERDNVADYAELDARLAWSPAKGLEISLVGQNLLKRRHYEFSNDIFGSPATMSERGMYGKVTWKF